VDGNEYVDLHCGYGAALAGHGHPAIVEAIRGQAALGTHFAQPTPAAILVAEELTRRFGLPLWGLANSATEATMDAVHLMRAITGRDLIIKVEGCYHGHHDSVQVSVCPEPEEVGPPHKPAQVRSSTGIPQAIVDLTLVVGFNDLEGVARLLDENPGRIAGMIIEQLDGPSSVKNSPLGIARSIESTATSAKRLVSDTSSTWPPVISATSPSTEPDQPALPGDFLGASCGGPTTRTPARPR
jgi:glutamate-1-semialdehyde aminotransferase